MELQELRDLAFGYFQKGNFITAISMQEKICKEKDPTYNDLKTLALFVITAGDYKKGLRVFNRLNKAFPDHNDAEIVETIGLCHMRLGNYDAAVAPFEKAAELNPTKANTHDGLSELYNLIGQQELSIKHGEESLRLKDLENRDEPLLDLVQVPVPSFNSNDPTKNIIAFSLWGKAEIYTKGALFNLQFARKIYPEWTCRFYVDASVPKDIIDHLNRNGAQVIMMEKPSHPYTGLFWRFMVCNDETVDRYLIRDADSIPSPRERAAVDDWIKSEKHFHAMRDYATHTELILAGMWGGVRGALPPLTEMFKKFITQSKPNKTVDQQFLRAKIWPTLKTSCIIHDSRHRLENTVDFPVGSELPKDKHVGQRFDAYLRPPSEK
ncbi:tetratricopeptide repeat protein [Terasakiella sp. A23]|uniref:tetratricopeptide repeat protein n=1 Tax=Terasakiella sp. FCG-A23 TaxID=3080561 RepID=UPI002952B2FE|nr:tetratricopeptide repeat protein [Terasakiella sp. A23]MDV7341642.1 tetratricopeptide repeat protein [Terasakiella sp. A23]